MITSEPTLVSVPLISKVISASVCSALVHSADFVMFTAPAVCPPVSASGTGAAVPLSIRFGSSTLK